MVRADLRYARDRMVREQLEARGIKNPEVLRAMRAIPRHLFVQEALAEQAYEDRPQPLGFGQTISQPYIVARMTELLDVQPGAKVLEIGTGSGYQAAVLAEMGAEVYTVERIRELYQHTRDLLMRMRCFRVKPKLDDGTMGWPDAAPFDRILVTACGPSVPQPLVGQLADPGMLIMPIGASRGCQELLMVSRQGGSLREERKGQVLFVDLVGRHGF